MLRNGSALLPDVRAFVGRVAPSLSCSGLWKRVAYAGCGRRRWQKIDEVVEALHIKQGEQVADLGAGGGYFTFPLAQAVGAAGRVYAVDIDDGLLTYIAHRARAEHCDNVGVVHAKLDDPLLPVGSIDLLFTCDAYHHLEDRVAYFRNARKYLKPGARLAVIDLKSHGIVAGWFGHSTPAPTVRQEIEAAGYQFQRSIEFLAKQSFQVFTVC